MGAFFNSWYLMIVFSLTGSLCHGRVLNQLVSNHCVLFNRSSLPWERSLTAGILWLCSLYQVLFAMGAFFNSWYLMIVFSLTGSFCLGSVLYQLVSYDCGLFNRFSLPWESSLPAGILWLCSLYQVLFAMGAFFNSWYLMIVFSLTGSFCHGSVHKQLVSHDCVLFNRFSLPWESS